MRYQAPRGTQDLLPQALSPADSRPHRHVENWRAIEAIFRGVCAEFGYGEVRTPVFETTDLFIRAVGEHTDIVSKEMYEVAAGGGDLGERETYTLRPEGTAPTLRAYVQHTIGERNPLARMFYLAPIFRHERPQAGRLRQHHQAGVEALGSDDPALDAEVIVLGLTYLRRAGITGEVLELNSVGCPECRPAYREALRAALKDQLPSMCGNCNRRYETNPLRMLDCKAEDWSVLGPLVPDILDHQCEACATHFHRLCEVLDTLETPYVRNPRLVRGLDYYVRTAFEITHDGLGAQSTILGGGRYDGLVEGIGGSPTPGIGFGSGIERVLLTLEALGHEFQNAERGPVFVVTLGEAARLPGLKLLNDLRATGIPAQIDYLGRSMKAQMRAANRAGARLALILGEDEIAQGLVAVKDMAGGAPQELLPREEAITRCR